MPGCTCLRRSFFVAALLFTSFVSAIAAEGASVALAWDPNSESNLQGYIVSYGTTPRQYTTAVNVGNTTSHTLTLLAGVTYYIAVQAYNQAGVSPYSNEVVAVVPAPLTVTNLTANRTSPQPTGTTTTFTATASGGTAPYQFKWWILSGATQTVGKNWSTSNSFAWTPTLPGSNYTIRVWARNASSTIDAPDNPAATLEMSFVITGNAAPTVNAGPDKSIALLSSATLTGTVSDDGLPIPPGAVTVSWTRVSGPGTVIFSAPTAATTTVTFSVAGIQVLRLTASDGALSASDDVTVTVTVGAGNVAPTVNAGADRAITLPSSATLTGTVSDDGLPIPPGAVTLSWTRVSGPGTVIFSAPTAATTTATFSAAGTQVLRLTASDGALSTSDEVTVTVSPAGLPAGWTAGDIDAPAVAGSTSYSGGVFTVRGAGVDIWDTSDQFHFAYRQLSGDGNVIARVASVENADPWSKAGVMIRADLTGSAANASMFVSAASGLAYQRRTTAGASTETTNTTGQAPTWVKLERRGNTITAFSSSDGVTWTQVDTQTMPLPATIYAGLAVTSHNPSVAITSVVDNVSVTTVGTNVAPTVNAGADRAITLPSSVTLTGTASDDGLPIPPGAVTVSWTRVSGPGTVLFGTPTKATTTASFSAAGTQVLRLTASDGALSASDDVTVTVSSGTPTVDAGADQSVALPSSATLIGTASDDGLPSPPGVLTLNWTRVSGPGTETFSAPTAATTTASFSVAGTQVLRLTASDGASSASDDVTVTVTVSAANVAPTVNAGIDQSIAFPSSATLTGTTSDDGLPIPPGAVSLLWTRVSGPGTVLFSAPTAATTTANFSAAGTYVLRLRASDGALNRNDRVTVTVNP